MSLFIEDASLIYNTILPRRVTQKLRLWRAPNILALFDIIDFDGVLFQFTGWAISKHSENLSLKIVDDFQHEIPYFSFPCKRQDISEAYFGDRSAREDCGVDIRFAIDPLCMNIKFIFSDGTNRLEIDYSMPELMQTINERKRWAGLLTPFPYSTWYRSSRPSKEELEDQRRTRFSHEPLFSLIVPAYNTPDKFLFEMADSVIAQTYHHWELCIADGSEEPRIGQLLKDRYPNEERIRYLKLDSNGGISANSNAALEMATGEFIVLLDHDDIIPPEALYENAKAINENPDADMIYSDEDKIIDWEPAGFIHYEPHFKSDFNPDMLRTRNYICHLFCARRSLVCDLGGFRSEFDGAQDYDLALRCSEQAREIVHIPKVLYHWRVSELSTAQDPSNKTWAFEAGRRAVESQLDRLGIEGTVTYDPERLVNRVDYAIQDNPLVSIVIPNKDDRDTLDTCLESIKRSTYGNYEVIVVENNSTKDETFEYYNRIDGRNNVRVIYWDGEFNFSKIINFGVENAKGDYLILLNNDTSIISEDWIEKLLMHCQRPEVGIVGSKLYYPDDTIQHAGVVVGLGGVAGHIFNNTPKEVRCYWDHESLQQDLTAVTAACAMVKRKAFDDVGGFNTDLRVAFNDVDFCLRVREKGYLVVFEPKAELYHYESKTRGSDLTAENKERFRKESAYVRNTWREFYRKGDPYYNKNLSLTRFDSSIKRNIPFEKNRTQLKQPSKAYKRFHEIVFWWTKHR